MMDRGDTSVRLECRSLPRGAVVRKLTGREGISELYAFDLDVVVVGDDQVDAAPLLGERATIVFARDGHDVRSVHGLFVEVRQRREAEDSASKFGIQTEVDAGADLAAIPDRLQGDLSLYSNAALEARKKLKHNKDLRRWIDKHWERLVVDKPDGARRVTFPEYAGTFTAFLRCVGPRRLCARERGCGWIEGPPRGARVRRAPQVAACVGERGCVCL